MVPNGLDGEEEEDDDDYVTLSTRQPPWQLRPWPWPLRASLASSSVSDEYFEVTIVGPVSGGATGAGRQRASPAPPTAERPI